MRTMVFIINVFALIIRGLLSRVKSVLAGTSLMFDEQTFLIGVIRLKD